jgi:alcohol dehydrogenase class IV
MRPQSALPADIEAIMTFTTTRLPEMLFGPGAFGALGERAAALAPDGPALIVADAFLSQNGTADRARELLATAGLPAALFGEIAGEPKAAHIRAATALAREQRAALVVGLGGGSALDIAKLVAGCARSGADPMHYALCAQPLPERPLRKILVPTTAGTGSEANGTCVFADDEGSKSWIHDSAAKADLAILDPELTVTLPAPLTAWCGMDAFVHAFEAATTRWSHAGAQLFAHRALRLIPGALERAIAAPGDLAARGDLLLAAFYAGFAIENCGTAVAHSISHGLAGLAAVHHGHATALGFEATLPWLVEAATADLDAAAQACGLSAANELPGFVSALMTRAGIERRLPAAFASITAADLGQEMRAEANRPMRRATVREVTDADIDRIAADILSLAASR